MARIQAEVLIDFSGGLNLNPDGFKLAPTESPDMCDIELSERGGFRLRRGSVTLGAPSPAEGASAVALWQFQPEGVGVSHLMANFEGRGVWRWTGSEWAGIVYPATVTPVFWESSGPVRSAVFKDRLYMQDGETEPARWQDGSNEVHVFDQSFAWNDNLENPTLPTSNGHLPKAKLMCSWMGSLWVAGVYEGERFYPNRLRWSHPNFPEDWHSKHYIDIDTGADGDVITAIAPFRDRLYVFKRSSVHVVTGAPPEGLTTFVVTRELGAPHQDAVAATEMGVYFFDPLEGVFLLGPNGAIHWQFEALYPALRDGRMSTATLHKAMLGWGARRLWLSIPYGGAAERSDVFVLDPQFGSRRHPGAWMRFCYGAPIGPFVEWSPPNGVYRFLAGVAADTETEGQVLALDQDVRYDEFKAGSEVAHRFYNGRFQTAWVDLNQPAMEKRWKRPEFVLEAGVAATINVVAYTNYRSGTARRRFRVRARGLGEGLRWGKGHPRNKWGRNKWAASGDDLNEIDRGASLGTARSVSLLLWGEPAEGAQAGPDWGINQVTFKYIPKKLRG